MGPSIDCNPQHHICCARRPREIGYNFRYNSVGKHLLTILIGLRNYHICEIPNATPVFIKRAAWKLDVLLTYEFDVASTNNTSPFSAIPRRIVPWFYNSFIAWCATSSRYRLYVSFVTLSETKGLVFEVCSFVKTNFEGYTSSSEFNSRSSNIYILSQKSVIS